MQRSQHLLLEPLVPPSPREEPKVEEPEAPMAARQRHQPGKPGSRSCLCHGEVLILLGHYGWLVSQEPLEHPGADRNGGRIYMRRCDVAAGAPLAPGDAVTFYLYADDRGLGAEEVRLVDGDRRRGHRALSCGAEARFRAEAEGVCGREGQGPAPPRSASPQGPPGSGALSAGAAEFVPGCGGVHAPPAPVSWMRAGAQDFVPPAQALHSAWSALAAPVPAVRPQNAINLAYFSDSDSDSDSDDDCGKAGSGGSSAGSTGAPSGSESDDEPLSPPPGLPLPPGLMASKRPMVPFRPPPGLSLP